MSSQSYGTSSLLDDDEALLDDYLMPTGGTIRTGTGTTGTTTMKSKFGVGAQGRRLELQYDRKNRGKNAFVLKQSSAAAMSSYQQQYQQPAYHHPRQHHHHREVDVGKAVEKLIDDVERKLTLAEKNLFATAVAEAEAAQAATEDQPWKSEQDTSNADKVVAVTATTNAGRRKLSLWDDADDQEDQVAVLAAVATPRTSATATTKTAVPPALRVFRSYSDLTARTTPNSNIANNTAAKAQQHYSSSMDSVVVRVCLFDGCAVWVRWVRRVWRNEACVS